MEQLDVTLGLQIISVSGTVNGVAVTWLLTAPGTWSAEVEKSEDGFYHISLNTIDNIGQHGTFDTVVAHLEEWIPLKTDWVSTDDYGPDDLNRVEADTDFIARQMAGAGYPVTLEPVKVDRTKTKYEFASSLSRLERNIDALREAFVTPPEYIEPKAWSANVSHDYRDANRVENNLQLLYNLLLSAIASFKRCGTFACGEDGGIY